MPSFGLDPLVMPCYRAAAPGCVTTALAAWRLRLGRDHPPPRPARSHHPGSLVARFRRGRWLRHRHLGFEL